MSSITERTTHHQPAEARPDARTDTSPRRDSPARTAGMLVLGIVVLGGNYARTALGPLQETLRSALHLTDNQVALLQGPALALPVVTVAIPLGFLIDRYSRVRLLLILSVLTLVGGWLTATASSLGTLIAARSLVGLTATATVTATLSLIADLYPPYQRGRATTVVSISQIAGMSASFALGGWLLVRFGSAPQSWQPALLWLHAPLLVVIVLVALMREPARTGVLVKNSSVLESCAELWQYRSLILPLLSGMVFVEMALGAVMVWAAPVLSRGFALPPDRVGAILASGFTVSGLLGPIVGGALADLCQRVQGPRLTLLTVSGLSVLTIPTGLFAYVPDLTVSTVVLVTFMTLVTATCVMGTTLFTLAIPNELRGACTAVMTAACILFGVGVAPLAVSFTSGTLGGPAMVGKALSLVGMVGCALGAAAFLMSRHHIGTKAFQ